ncbi:MAG TPA: hypothetical protein VKA81_00210, partial [Verrucomicrobiae bacterium]|nr:hypothetical protein [Verrucomicrobiae bacterium]
LGSKADAVLTLLDASGRVLASNNGFDGSPDPLLAYTFVIEGRYGLRVSEMLLGGSTDHFYRLSIGAFPYVTGFFPLSVPSSKESDVELIGYNLPPEHKVKVKAEGSNEIELPRDVERFRSRRVFKVMVGNWPELVESEPNDTPEQATRIVAPGSVAGRIWHSPPHEPTPHPVPLPLRGGEGARRAGEGERGSGIVKPPPEPRSSRREEAQSEIRNPKSEIRNSESLLTPAATVHGHNARTGPGSRAGGEQSDVDLFRFEAKAGAAWIIETQAAQLGSPVDTKIEVLHADGKPLERLLLQAVRNTAINFRSIDSNGNGARLDNYEEMELNEYIYFNGEVVKLFRMPQGPDSDMLFYASNGKRRAYFDSSATAHALDEAAYVVEPHPPGAKLVSNGLPVFPLYYANDDDGERKLGSDSKLFFTAPADGPYLIRVTDARGYSGERFVYRLMVRDPKPDFKVTLNGANPTINAGSGREFSVSAERLDGFDGDIKVEVSDLPPGFSVSTPLVIQAGHTEAKGTINAALDAAQPDESNAAASKVIATATLAGHVATKEVNNLGKITLGDKPKLFVYFAPAPQTQPAAPVPNEAGKPLEITVAPGQTAPAMLKIQRNGHDDLVTFTVENLPHGVIVDNIGLNGVLIPKGESERQISLTAAKWVPEQDRLCYAVESQAGRQTSLSVLLRVRKTPGKVTVAGK